MMEKLDSLFPIGEIVTYSGTLSVWHCAGLGERQCGQSETTPVTYIVWSFLMSVVSASLPGSGIFTVVCLVYV